MTPDISRSFAAWVYLIPRTTLPLLVVGAVDQRLREDLANAGIEARYADPSVALDATGAGGLVLAARVPDEQLVRLVASLPEGAPVVLLPSAAGRLPRPARRRLVAAGVEVDGVYATLPGTATPRLLAPLQPAAVFRGALHLHSTTNPRAAALKRVAIAASHLGLTALFAPGLLIHGHRRRHRTASIIETLAKQVGADAAPALLNPSAGRGVKAIARLATQDGSAVAYAKLAAAGVRGDDLANEAEMLTYLASLASGQPHPFEPHPFEVPRVITTGEQDDHRYLLLTPLAEDAGVADGRHHPAVHEALTSLATIGGTAGTIEQSSTWREAHAALGAQPDPAAGVLRAALERARALTEGVSLPLGVAHRDLAAWNVRLSAGHAAILDWEWARRDAVPFMDLFHHLLHTEVHSRGASVEDAARRLFLEPTGGGDWVREYGAAIGIHERVEEVAFACFLAYLVDWYLLQRDRGDESGVASPYVALLRLLLDERSGMGRAWLAR